MFIFDLIGYPLDNEDISAIAPESAQAAPTAEVPLAAPSAPEAPRFDPRRRIRELLSIPERDRSDAEWDELNELEIQTAPGNRIGNQPPAAYAGNKPAFNPKNRMKGKSGGGKPGGQGGQGGHPGQGGRPPGAKPQHHHNKPRPA